MSMASPYFGRISTLVCNCNKNLFLKQFECNKKLQYLSPHDDFNHVRLSIKKFHKVTPIRHFSSQSKFTSITVIEHKQHESILTRRRRNLHVKCPVVIRKYKISNNIPQSLNVFLCPNKIYLNAVVLSRHRYCSVFQWEFYLAGILINLSHLPWSRWLILFARYTN